MAMLSYCGWTQVLARFLRRYPLNVETPFIGLAIDPTDGQFYGMTEESELVRIDPTTGNVEPIGTLNLKPSNRSPLAINSEGDLFGASFISTDASGRSFSSLVKIDKTTGIATLAWGAGNWDPWHRVSSGNQRFAWSRIGQRLQVV